MLGAADTEVTEARATDGVTRTELTGELSFIFVAFFMELFFLSVADFESLFTAAV